MKFFVSDTHMMCDQEVHDKLSHEGWGLVEANSLEALAVDLLGEGATVIDNCCTFPHWITSKDGRNGLGVLKQSYLT